MKAQKHTCTLMAPLKRGLVLVIFLPQLLLTSCSSKLFSSSFVPAKRKHIAMEQASRKHQQEPVISVLISDSIPCIADGATTIAAVSVNHTSGRVMSTHFARTAGDKAGRNKSMDCVVAPVKNEKVSALRNNVFEKEKRNPGRQEEKEVNYMAVASILSALLGLTLLPVIGSIMAIVLGIIALVQIYRNPETMSGKGWAIAGIILGTLTLAALVYLFILLFNDVGGLGWSC